VVQMLLGHAIIHYQIYTHGGRQRLQELAWPNITLEGESVGEECG